MPRKKTDVDPEFGHRLAAELRRGGWTNRAFADEVGVHENSISKYLKGSFPDQKILRRIAKTLECSIDWLLMGPGAADEYGAGQRPDIPRRRVLGDGDRPSALERWLNRDREMRELLTGWAQVRLQGLEVKVDAGDLVETVIKALASKLLEGLAPKEKQPRG